MNVIFALSNPASKEFTWTRHNVGRLFITEHLLPKYGHSEDKHKNYIAYRLKTSRQTVVCLSETYMNLSGQAVGAFLKKNSAVTHSQLMVVHDDLQHKFGNVRVKQGGSAQGHNGVASVIGAVGAKSFPRLQLGIGRPASRDPEDVARYVLTNFSKSERLNLLTMFAKGEQLLKVHGFL